MDSFKTESYETFKTQSLLKSGRYLGNCMAHFRLGARKVNRSVKLKWFALLNVSSYQSLMLDLHN